MIDDLEGILEKSRTGALESADLIESLKLISKGKYDRAKKLLDAIAAETADGNPASPLTHSAVVAQLYSGFITYDSNIKAGEKNAVSGRRAAARTNYDAAVNAADNMQTFVDARMPNNRRLKGYLAEKKAAAMTKAGNYAEAFDAINTPELANDENAALMRGQIKYELGDYAVAETELRKVYDRNPKRKGVAEMLAKTYERLASVTDPATTDTTGIDAAIVTAWNEAVELLGTNGTALQRQKIMEVINGIGAPAGDANKQSMLARAYHALAVVDRRNRSYGVAIEHLRTSVGILATPEAYTNLADTHRIIAFYAKAK